MTASRSGSPKGHGAAFFHVGLFLLILTLVGLAVYTPWLGLVGDDWWFFAHLSDGLFPAAQLYENPARPMVAYLWAGLWHVLGLHIWAYYIFIFVIQWLTALMVFVMLRIAFRWSVTNAAVVAAFFLLYPADTAHVYLSTLSTRVCVLFAVTGVFLWLRAWQVSPRPILLLSLGSVLMALSLITYETPLFLIAMLPLTSTGVVERGGRARLLRALTCYAVLAAYLIFRLGVAFIVSRRSVPYYTSIDLTPGWLWSQFRVVPAATIWQGWLYALKSMLDLGLTASAVMLALSMVFILMALGWLRRDTAEAPGGWKQHLRLVGVGIILSVVAVAPVMVSTFSLERAVGTLDGRFVHGAALGHAVLVTGLCALLSSWLPLSNQGRIWAQTTFYAVLMSIALIGSLGVQREYARSWQMQLRIVHSLQEQSPSFRDGTAIVLLDVPAGAFDTRFYYPFTQLARRFYANPTLDVLPWQRGFPSNQQLLAFGQEGSLAVVEVVQRETRAFDYHHMVAFQVEPDGGLRPIHQISLPYLCREMCRDLPIPLPEGWRQASEPVLLNDLQHLGTNEAIPDTAWRQVLLSCLDFANRVAMP
jgi:hypothetical protein